MKKNGYSAALILLAAFLAGCTNVATFDYNAAPGSITVFQEAGRSGKKTVAVLPFMDQRSSGILDPDKIGERGSLYLGFLPLMPFGYLIKSEPEKSDDFVSLGRFHFDPANDLANAAMVSLKASNLFAGVTRSGNLQQAQTDYIWRGKLLSTAYRGNMYSYCITYFFSHVFWIIGVPSGTSWNRLAVQFELIDRKSGQAVWRYDFNREDSITHWLYARVGKDCSMYALLMKLAMNQALRDLSAKVPLN